MELEQATHVMPSILKVNSIRFWLASSVISIFSVMIMFGSVLTAL